jgi:Uma2 family endonuclease
MRDLSNPTICYDAEGLANGEGPMSEPAISLMSIPEFLEWQKLQDVNYELVDGIPVLPLKSMTGATSRHDRITVNILADLHRQLRRGPCRPSTSDIAVKTTIQSIRRPDVTVQCGPYDPMGLSASEPRVVVEVLSPSTMNYDRVKKLEEYRRVASIAVILLVDTEKPRVTVHRRVGTESWDISEFSGLGAAFDLPEIGAGLALADVFEGVHDSA